MTETTSYESDVDHIRGQLYVLAGRIEDHCGLIDYDPNERLDWLDLERIALQLVGVVHNYVQAGEEERA